MIFSPSSEYALHALIYLAGNGRNTPIQVKEIAKAENIPKHFLAKILNHLEHKKLVNSIRGPGGGFSLARSAEKIQVSEIINIFDSLDDLNNICILGLDKCQEKSSCALHKEWKGFRQSLISRVKQLTIADLSKMSEKKRKGIKGE